MSPALRCPLEPPLEVSPFLRSLGTALHRRVAVEPRTCEVLSGREPFGEPLRSAPARLALRWIRTGTSRGRKQQIRRCSTGPVGFPSGYREHEDKPALRDLSSETGHDYSRAYGTAPALPLRYLIGSCKGSSAPATLAQGVATNALFSAQYCRSTTPRSRRAINRRTNHQEDRTQDRKGPPGTRATLATGSGN